MIGAVVGEAPGRTGSVLSAYVPGSAAARLCTMADVEPSEFVKLARCNLFDVTPKMWTREEAKDAAVDASAWLVARGVDRLVLLGRRVTRAFADASRSSTLYSGSWGSPQALELQPAGYAVLVRVIPHPSGRNRQYNADWARNVARVAVRWVLGHND